MHPIPWRVTYFRRCPEWHERSRPRVVDAVGVTVCEMPQHVGHPGEYDQQADDTARQIVAAANAVGGLETGELESLLAVRRRLLAAVGECRNDCERARLEAILYDEGTR